MRALYVTDGIAPYVVGGMQAVSRRQILGLARAGVDVSYIHSFRGEQRVPTDLLGDEFVVEYPFIRGLRRWSPWHYAAELRAYSEEVEKVVRRSSPDLIYSEGPLVYATLRQQTRPPVVFHPHGLDMYQNQMSLVRNLRSLALRPIFRFHAMNADCVITQGGELTEILTKRIGVARDRIAYLPNAVPESACSPPKHRTGRPLRCLFVGRDDPKKGLPLLLSAMRTCSGVTLDIVGVDGPQSDQLSWHGMVTDVDRVQSFYRDADVLILPSYSEGMATVLLEAMRFGMPAIATDVGATREVVVNGKTGWLIEPGSVDELAGAIERVRALEDAAFSRFSSSCVRHVRENFLEDRVTERLVDLLKDVVEKRSA